MGDETYLISLYVDDILIAGTNEDKIDKKKKEFTERYEMKDLGELNHYLGMKITRTNDSIKVDQTQYIKDMITKYSYLLDGLEYRHFDTPMERDLKLRKLDAETETAKQRAYANKFPHMNPLRSTGALYPTMSPLRFTTLVVSNSSSDSSSMYRTPI